MSDASPTAACPDDAEVAAFVHGGLDPERERQVEQHLDGCVTCGRVVAELARIFTDSQGGLGPREQRAAPDDGAAAQAGGRSLRAEPGTPSSPGAPSNGGGLRSEELAVTLGPNDEVPIERPIGVMLSAGAEVGRYRVLECVGVGGMGVVYSAYDPELDRRVALKLLRGSEDDPATATRNGRLLREAQALAKLAHPNVITVHDVGTWKEQVFVAMEFVQGGTLDAWLRAEKRTWPEIREVFVAAGRGLAAAHAAGMVHRDFKPENVLIGEDGRVRVTDFGLARQADRAPNSLVATDELDSAAIPNLESLSQGRTPVVSLTETGTLVGTPAYMAPEQYEQRPADAASDQFAFCVALYEAIYGERPFAGRTLAELASNVLDGRIVDASSELVIPRPVRVALRRGLSRRRRDRFASIEELLVVLGRRSGRRWWFAAAAGVGVAAVGGGLWAYGNAEPLRSPFCADDGGLAELWSKERRAAIREAFDATELQYAEQSAERFLQGVDEYVFQWEALRMRSCGPEAKTEGPGVLALRERCLERRRVTLETMLDVYDEPDAGMVARAVGSVMGLPSLEACGEAEALMAELPPPVPLQVRGDVDEVRDELARTKGLIAAGRYEEGLALSRELHVQAEAIGHQPLLAETQLMVGRLLDRTGEAEAANVALERASLLGVASRHRRIVAEALIHQVYVLGVTLPQMELAELVADRAAAEIEGAGMGVEAQGPLAVNRATLAYRKGDIARAIELGQEALKLRDRDKEPLRWADAAFNLAAFQMAQGSAEDAVLQFEAYADTYRAALGPMHPEVASGYQNLGVAYYNAGRIPEARKTLEQADEIRKVTLGSDHPEYARTLNMLGSVALAQGRNDAALDYIERGIAVLEATGMSPVDIATNRVDLAAVLIAVDRIEQAEQEISEAVRLMIEAFGEDHHELATAYHVYGEVAAARGDEQGLREHMARAREIRASISGGEHPDVDRVDVDLAVMLSGLGHRQETLDWFQDFLARKGDELDNYAVLHAHFAYAQLLWEDPSKRSLARKHALQARGGFEAQKLTQSLGDVEQWLAEHPAAAG